MSFCDRCRFFLLWWFLLTFTLWLFFVGTFLHLLLRFPLQKKEWTQYSDGVGCCVPLVCWLRSAAASHFARRGKSAAAAAITLSTQRENVHQIEWKQNNICRPYICIYFFICPQVMGDFSSPLFVVKRRIFVDYRKKQIRIIFLAWKKSNCSEFVVIIQFAAHLPPVLTVWWPTKVTRGGRSVQQL